MNKIKLFGGIFKGQEILYYSSNVRPTIFIIRKILFNWLKDCIIGARVLDIFGGSGILGFESISRGASYLLIIEKIDFICKNILLNMKKLNLLNVNLINIDVFKWFDFLKITKFYIKSFDIIFIDPPYDINYLFCCLEILLKNNFITKNSYIYIESYVNYENEFIYFSYKIFKSRVLGNIRFYIIKKM